MGEFSFLLRLRCRLPNSPKVGSFKYVRLCLTGPKARGGGLSDARNGRREQMV